MTFGTIITILIGRRDAILTLAATRWSLLVGVLLVLTASLARNYDGAWIPGEPTVLLHGLAASTGNAFLLYALVFLVVPQTARPAFWRGYICFLGVFWMTAPMGWLYAIPYERWLSPVEAVNANLYTLAFVSVWRVALITRVLCVLFGVPWWRMIWFVMLFADVVFFAAAMLMPTPVIDFMGGLRQSPQEQAIAGISLMVRVFTVLSAPVWFIGALAATRNLQGKWASDPALAAGARPTISAWLFLSAAVAGNIALLVWAQPEQHRRFHAERLLRAGQPQEALLEMSRHARSDYPPLWDPYPRAGYRESAEWVADVPRICSESAIAPWVQQTFAQKYIRRLEARWGYSYNGLAGAADRQIDLAERDSSWRLDPTDRDGTVWLLGLRGCLSDDERGRLATLLDLDDARQVAAPTADTP